MINLAKCDVEICAYVPTLAASAWKLSVRYELAKPQTRRKVENKSLSFKEDSLADINSAPL